MAFCSDRVVQVRAWGSRCVRFHPMEFVECPVNPCNIFAVAAA